MRLIVLLSVLLCLFSPYTSAKTKHKPTKANANMDMQDIKRYLLTWQQIEKLSPKAQVEYYKFLVHFIAALEDMQPRPANAKEAGKKYSLMDTLYKLMQQIQPEAYAYTQVNDASMIGKMCVYGGNASAYKEYVLGDGSKRYWCSPLGNGGCGDSGMTECGANSGLFNFMNPKGNGGPLCVPTFPENQTESEHGLTWRCVDAFEKRLGGPMDQVVKAEMAKAKGNKKMQEDWNTFVENMKKAVNDLETTNFGGVTLREYCAQGADGRYNAVNFNKQHEECEALARLFASVRNSDAKVEIPAPLPPPVEVRNPTPSSDSKDLYTKCHNDQTHPELGELQCVNCAIREAGPGSRGDASKWITLLGITARTEQKNEAGEGLTNRVIKMLLSTAYCTDSEYPNDAGFNPSAAQGLMSTRGSNLSGYGFSSTSDLRNLLGDYNNADASGFPWNFEGLSIFYRRARYGYYFSKAGSHSHYSGALKSCLASASSRLNNNPAFNYCAGNDYELNNPTGSGSRSENTADLSSLIAFCNTMVRACGADSSICVKNNLIANSKTLNEKERRTKGDFSHSGVSPRVGYYSQNFEMPGNQARCPRREFSDSYGGASGTGAASTSGTAGGSSSGPGAGSH